MPTTMNNQSPLIPQGSLLDQRNKGRARVKIAVFLVLAIHGIGLMALLMQGCKQQPDGSAANGTASTASDATNNLAPAFVEPTNAPSASNIVSAATNANMAPVEAPPVTTPTVNPASDYVIVKGDMFSTIAKKFHVSIKALQEANPAVEPTKLKIGQPIHIPASSSSAASNPAAGSAAAPDATGSAQTYSVKSGDSLTKIAGEFGVTIKALRSFNSLKTDKIVVGQKLKIPAKGTSAPTTTAATNGGGQ